MVAYISLNRPMQSVALLTVISFAMINWSAQPTLAEQDAGDRGDPKPVADEEQDGVIRYILQSITIKERDAGRRAVPKKMTGDESDAGDRGEPTGDEDHAGDRNARACSYCVVNIALFWCIALHFKCY
jgi:hypothetical protein